MNGARNKMKATRKETDSLGEVDVAADKLWGAQTQRSLEPFSIGKDVIPPEMITAYAVLKKAAANANHAGKRLNDQRARTHSITIMADGCTNFRKFLIEGTRPNVKRIKEYVDRSLMLVTALSPIIGDDKASKIMHYARDNDLTLKAAALIWAS